MNFEAFQCLLIKLQEMFNLYWFGQTQNQDVRSNGFLAFLMSTQNRRNLTILQDTLQDRNGIRRKVVLKNRKKLCLKLACEDWSCDTPVSTYMVTPEATEMVLTEGACYLFDPDNPVTPMVPSWDPDEFKELCIDQPMAIAETVADYIDNLEYELEKKYLQDFRVNIVPTTCDVDGNPRPSVQLFIQNINTPTNSPANPLVYQTIDEQFRKSFTSGSYAIIGGGRMKAYMDRRGIRNGGSFTDGNSALPVNDGRSQWRFYYSWAFDEVFEEKSFLTIKDGVVQLLQWSENKGYKSDLSYDEVRWSSFVSNYGLTFDMDWAKETSGQGKKCVKITYAIRHTGELYVAPGGGCDVNDCYNGVLWWRDCGDDPFFVCPPDPAACEDIGATYTNTRYLNYELQLANDFVFAGAVLNVAGVDYAATSTDPVAGAIEIQSLLRNDYPWATFEYSAVGDGSFTITGVPSISTPTITTTANPSQLFSITGENHVLAITPDTGVDTIAITVNGAPAYSGLLDDAPINANNVLIQGGIVYIVQHDIYKLPATVVAILSGGLCPDSIDVKIGWDIDEGSRTAKSGSTHFTLMGADKAANAYAGGVFDAATKTTKWTESAIINALVSDPDYPTKYADGSLIDPNNAYISSFTLGVSYYDEAMIANVKRVAENKEKDASGKLWNNGPAVPLKTGETKTTHEKGSGTDFCLELPCGMAVPFGVTISEKVTP